MYVQVRYSPPRTSYKPSSCTALDSIVICATAHLLFSGLATFASSFTIAMCQRANRWLRSTGSVTPRPVIQDTDRDAFALPGNDHVYLTQTKDGRPALGRKKPSRLLQDFGFDILGQSFGVPSRKDYERHGRSLSAASQTSGLVTAPVTPQLDRKTRSYKENRRMYTYEDTESPVVRRGTSSTRSSSTPAPIAMARRHRQAASKPQQHVADGRNPSLQWPRMFNQSHVPPPPPPPPPSVVSWHNTRMMNIGMAPTPISYYSAAHHPGYQPGYPYGNIAIPQGAQIWANPQCHPGFQRPNPPGIVGPQTSAHTSAVPMLPIHQQFSQSQPAHTPYMQTIPATHLANIPPPLPPQQNWPPARVNTTNNRKTSRKNKTQVDGAGTIINQALQAQSSSKSEKLMHEEPLHSEDVKQTLSERIRHVHVCGGCGRKRSRRYQKAHPLRRGEIPALNYCYSCLKDAADTDDGASEGDIAETTKPWRNDERRAPTGSKYTNERSRGHHRWVKKSNPIGSLSKLFSCEATLNPPPPPPRSISSAEESSSRASSPGVDLDEINSMYKPAVSPRHHAYKSTNNRTVQDELEMPAQRYTRVDSLNSNHVSPLVPREIGMDKAKQEGEARTGSNKKPTLAQPRTRIPRPRRRLETVGGDPSLSKSANGPALVHDRKPVSPHLDTSGAKGVTPMQQSAGTGAVSKSSTQVISEDAHEMAKRKHTQATVKAGEKSQVSSSQHTNSQNASSDVWGHNIQAFMRDSSGTTVAVASKAIPKDSVDKHTKHTDHGLYSAEPHILLNCNSELNSEQTAAGYRVPSSENSARRPFNDNSSKGADKFGVTFDWDDPLTPKDAPYASTSRSPRIVSDSWSEYQTDLEREAEEMAEHDLASAGKLFDSLSDSLGGSATSAFPLSSFVTTSNMSIVSYNTDSDCSDSDIAVANKKEARMQKTAKTIEANKLARQIGAF